jgi:hypothetical protein
MFASTPKSVALAIVVAAVAAPATFGSSSTVEPVAGFYTDNTSQALRQTSTQNTPALGAQTEAKGFLALQRAASARAVAADATPRLGAQSEAKGYRALVRYQEELAARPPTANGVASSFAWGDALVGAALTTGVFLVGAAAALALRRRQAPARLR